MKLLTIAFFSVSITTFAQESSQYRACIEKAKAQTEMKDCANEEATRADARLNQAYSKLLERAAHNPELLTKLKAAENAWVAYRDADMDATYPAKDKQAEYGSLYPTESDLLRAKLTERQVQVLEELFEHQTGNRQSEGTDDAGRDAVVVSAFVPFYPRASLLAHIQGTVTIHVTTNGKIITGVASASGPPMLVAAAQDNIRSWKLQEHPPTSFVAKFQYRIDEPAKCDVGNATVVLHMPSEVQISAAGVRTCDPVSAPAP